MSGGPRWCGSRGGLCLLVVLAAVEGLQRGPLQLGARGPRLWCGVVAGASRSREGREAGELVEGSSTLHADFLWRVNPWNARSLNKDTQHEAKLVRMILFRPHRGGNVPRKQLESRIVAFQGSCS